MSDRPANDTKTANTMWGGRFAAGPDAIMEAINASIGFDQRLHAQDIRGSRAHAAMLAAQGIIASSDAKAIREGLLTVLSEIEAGDFPFSTALEDIHMNVEARLKEVIGDAAGRLHTARSRNDQVATDFRLWVRDQTDAAIAGIEALQRAFLEQAAAGAGFSTATDLADWLVRALDLPFREAHHVTGALVALAERKGCDLPDLTLAEMQTGHAGITQEVYSVLGVENSVASRTSYGGTAPDQVRAQVARWKERLA